MKFGESSAQRPPATIAQLLFVAELSLSPFRARAADVQLAPSNLLVLLGLHVVPLSSH